MHIWLCGEDWQCVTAFSAAQRQTSESGDGEAIHGARCLAVSGSDENVIETHFKLFKA